MQCGSRWQPGAGYTCAGHMEFGGSMAEFRFDDLEGDMAEISCWTCSSTSPYTVAARLCWWMTCPMRRGRDQLSLGKKIDEGSSKGELGLVGRESVGRGRRVGKPKEGGCLSPKSSAGSRLRSAETRTRRTGRRSRPRVCWRTVHGWRRVDVAHLATTGFERATIVKCCKCWVCSWRELRSKNHSAERECETAHLISEHSSPSHFKFA